MANDFITADFILRSVLFEIEEKLASMPFFKNPPSLFYQNPQGWMTGDTVHVPRPNSFSVRTGVTMQPQETQEGKLAVSVNERKGVDVTVTTQDLTIDTTPENYKERVLDPAQTRLAAYIDEIAFKNAIDECPNAVQMSSGENRDIFSDILEAHAMMSCMSIPKKNRILFVSPTVYKDLVKYMSTVRSDELVKAAIAAGEVDSVSSSEVRITPNLPFVETVKSPMTFDAYIDDFPTWANVKDSWKFNVKFKCQADTASGSTRKIPKGTIFTMKGMKAVNPLTHTTQDMDKCFMLLEDITGIPPATLKTDYSIPITPPPLPMPATGDAAHVNVSNYPEDTDIACTILNQPPTTTSGQVYSVNRPVMLLAHRDAMICPQVRLMMPKGVVGQNSDKSALLLRIASQFRISDDSVEYRIDHQCGARLLEPDAAVIIPCG